MTYIDEESPSAFVELVNHIFEYGEPKIDDYDLDRCYLTVKTPDSIEKYTIRLLWFNEEKCEWVLFHHDKNGKTHNRRSGEYKFLK